MALEKHSVGGEVQVGLGIRKNLERALLRTALKRDALALEQIDLLLRSRYGLEGQRVMNAVIHAPSCEFPNIIHHASNSTLRPETEEPGSRTS